MQTSAQLPACLGRLIAALSAPQLHANDRAGALQPCLGLHARLQHPAHLETRRDGALSADRDSAGTVSSECWSV